MGIEVGAQECSQRATQGVDGGATQDIAQRLAKEVAQEVTKDATEGVTQEAIQGIALQSVLPAHGAPFRTEYNVARGDRKEIHSNSSNTWGSPCNIYYSLPFLFPTFLD